MSFLSLGEWPSREYRTTGVRLTKRCSHRCWVDEPLSLPIQIRGLNMTFAAGNALSANARRPPFDNVTIFFHWVTVIIVLAMFTSAWLLSRSQDVAFTSVLLQIHRSLGMTIWFTTAFRFAWRLTNAKLPSFPDAMTAVHRSVGRWSEYGLYTLTLVQPATGMGARFLPGDHSLCSCGRLRRWCRRTRRSG